MHDGDRGPQRGEVGGRELAEPGGDGLTGLVAGSVELRAVSGGELIRLARESAGSGSRRTKPLSSWRWTRFDMVG